MANTPSNDSEWWDEMSEEEQEQYLIEHPKSKKNLVAYKFPVDHARVEKIVEEIEPELLENADYVEHKDKVEKFFNADGESKDEHPDINGVKIEAVAACILLAALLAVTMPSHATDIFNVAYLVGENWIDAIDAREEFRSKDSKTSEEDEREVNLRPEEIDQADERKRRLVEIGLDEDGNDLKDSKSESKASGKSKEKLNFTKQTVEYYITAIKGLENGRKRRSTKEDN